MTHISNYGPLNEAKCLKNAQLNEAFSKAASDGKYKFFDNSAERQEWFDNYHVCPPFFYEEKVIGTECNLGLKPSTSFQFDGETITTCMGIVSDATFGGYYPGYAPGM